MLEYGSNSGYDKMKILLYAEPTGFSILGPNANMASVIRAHFHTWLATSLQDSKDVEIKTIVPEMAFLQDKKTGILQPLHPICFKDEYLKQIFPQARSYQDMFLAVFNGEISEKQHQTFQQIIKKILSPDWRPDLIISYPIHNPLLQRTFPQVLALMTENGLFSRPPFCRTLRYEPIHFLNGFPDRFEQEIRSFPITVSQRQALANFKTKLRKLIDAKNPFKKQLTALRQRFKYLLLCPIPSDNAYKETIYDDQYLYLLNILSHVPPNIGVIITFHDSDYAQLNTTIVRMLQQKYPNLIYNPPTWNAFVSQSLNFFEYCDAIVNMHSMTGTQALLWDLKVISLDKRYSKWFCDKQGLDNLEEFLASPTPDKSGLLYWYMTHFTVFEKNFNTPGWYENYFKNKVERFQKEGITFDFYEQINDFDELSEYILTYIRNYLRHIFKRRFYLLYQRYSQLPQKLLGILKSLYRYR